MHIYSCLPATGLCSFISSCAVNYLPAPFPVFLQQPGPCTGREGGKRGGLLSSDIVIKESPQPAGPAHSHTVVWLPDTLWFTHTAVCTGGRRKGPLRETRGSETLRTTPPRFRSGEFLGTWQRQK